jgi:hypothetical protein
MSIVLFLWSLILDIGLHITLQDFLFFPRLRLTLAAAPLLLLSLGHACIHFRSIQVCPPLLRDAGKPSLIS